MKLRILLPLILLVLLVPCQVMADELWVQNQGGLEIVIDGTVTDVQYDGLYAWNPEYSEGQAKVAAADIKDGWVVITGTFTGYTIEVACNQKAEDVNPEVRWVKDAPAVTNQGSSDARPTPTFDFPDPYWFWT